MKVKVNHALLSDAPLNAENASLFRIAHKDTGDFIEDLLKGTPTCYLVSGYRGSGKSSFIRKIESEISTHNLSPGKVPVFVYCNFPKYQDHRLALRKLIRCFYNTISKLEAYKNLRNKKEENEKALLLESLYEKTFYETYKQRKESLKVSHILSFKFDWAKMIYALLGIGIGTGIYFGLTAIFGTIESQVMGGFLTVLLFVGAFFKFSQSYKRERERMEEFSRKSMYDNEIADFFLLDVLESFKQQFRIIFVLDELDKLEEEHVTKLLNEMKPFLIAGSASFVVVAGQNLYHQCTHSRSIDDALLTSLFSKFIHVPLFAFAEFENIFNALIIHQGTVSEGDKELLEKYVHHLLLEAKRIPRRFIGLIRQNITWENGNAFLYINDTPELDTSVKMNKAILSVCEREIVPEALEEPVKDYCIMQLYLKASLILSKRNKSFTREEIINEGKENK